jgi:DNA-binding GntR family transcriptional regulator
LALGHLRHLSGAVGTVSPEGSNVTEINRLPLYQQAYLALRQRIASGEFAPGMRLDVQTVADELDISRTPVREAIRQLLQDGLLEVERDGRVRVFDPNVSDLAELYIARASLEATAVAVVVATSEPLDFSRLEDAVERGRRGLERGDWQDTAQANRDFHETIIQASRSVYAEELTDVLRIRIIRFRNLALQFRERQRRSLEGHARILEMVREGDPNAELEIYRHVLEAGAWAVRALLAHGDDESPSVRFVQRWLPEDEGLIAEALGPVGVRAVPPATG